MTMSDSIAVMQRSGKTVLLVEQNVRFGLRHSQQGIVMESGRVLIASAASALLENPEMADLFFGGYTGETSVRAGTKERG